MVATFEENVDILLRLEEKVLDGFMDWQDPLYCECVNMLKVIEEIILWNQLWIDLEQVNDQYNRRNVN